MLARLLPKLKLPVSMYLDFTEMIDSKEEENRRIEAPMIAGYQRDPDFDRRHSLPAILSLLMTPPPRPLAELRTPTMFIVPRRGFAPSYARQLFERLPAVRKQLVEVDGSVFWMCSHPREAARIICDWFDATLRAVAKIP